MIIDTHAHYDDEAFDKDRAEVLLGLREAGVEAVINVCASPESLFSTPELVRKYPFVYGAIGLHPDEVGWFNEERFEELPALLQQDKILAVGEIGLDYHWNVETAEVQKEWFVKQIRLADEAKLPVIIHSRDAAKDTLEIVEKEDVGRIGGVMHCYSYSLEDAVKYTDMGLFLGIGGVVTFKNGKKLKRVVREISLSHLILETDCPYLAPEPFRGRRNNSGFLRHVVQEIAELKGVSPEEVVEVTTDNARRLFGIPKQK
ncbi:MAG: TatD family hydrolase [Clostridiales bacterium]|nr:TatD family hydrolase [Clostridiales bacterium]